MYIFRAEKKRTQCIPKASMAKSSSTSKSIADAFMSTTQGRVSVIIALTYAAASVLLGLCPSLIVVLILKLAFLAYTNNCLVAGNCKGLSWLHVLSMALFCAVDVGGLAIMNRMYRAITSDDGSFEDGSFEFRKTSRTFLPTWKVTKNANAPSNA